MKKEPIIVNVYLWGTCIGKLNWDFEKHCSVFQFTDEYRKQDYDICPSTHPKRTPLFASFYGNKDKLYQGLPEFLADALPDKWGASLFDQWLTDNIFFFKQKTAYEIKECDWSSDVCSSDLVLSSIISTPQRVPTRSLS